MLLSVVAGIARGVSLTLTAACDQQPLRAMGLSDADSSAEYFPYLNSSQLVAHSSNNTMDSNSNAGYHDTDDATAATKPWPLLRQSLWMVVILSFAYVVVFFLSIVNNSLVVAVIYRNPQLRTITNIFIANLAVADILVSILVLPITLLGNLFEGRCKLLLFRQFPRVYCDLNILGNDDFFFSKRLKL